MRDTLADALRALDGQCLVTEAISELLDSVQEDDIPEVWMDVAYPTMEDLPGFMEDLKERCGRTKMMNYQKVASVPKQQPKLQFQDGLPEVVAKGRSSGAVLDHGLLRARRLPHLHPVHRQPPLRPPVSRDGASMPL